MASDTVQNGQAVHAAYLNAERKARRGYAIDTGGAVSINTGTLDQADTLSVTAADYWFGGQPVSAPAQDVRIDGGASDPRKDVVYLDGNGDVHVAKGTPAPVPDDQQGIVRFQTYRPSPPDLADTDAVLLAEVWVPAGANEIIADDVADRRKFENQTSILATQSITLTGGANPAADVHLDGVGRGDQLQDVDVLVTPDADPGFAGDYAYNFDWSRYWDDNQGAVDVDVTATWDQDPGAGNDVSATIYVIHHDL